MAEQQVIPARHGTATFVPAGQTIKIINTSGTQVVDTWAFALPSPPGAKPGSDEAKAQEKDKKDDAKQQQQQETPQKKTPAKKGGNDLPSQEDAEKATQDGVKEGEQQAQDASGQQQQKNTWSSYVPSIGWSSGTKGGKGGETQQQKDSKTWASYFPSGRGFSNYVPKTATDTVSSFANTHQRDPNKSYLEQLQDFSRTPVGAAGWTGLSALSGSGYGSSMYAGYQAYSAKSAANAPQMEFMSMPHSRAAMLHLRPREKDTLVSNLREPMLTMVEDTSGGVHDTLMAACDPQRYRGLEVENWEEHGSCAENLVLALKELNERAGLKGAKAVGADVTINSVPAPLNLFMNIPWTDNGDISFDAPQSKAEGFVRLKAERDVVVVMSACPQDVLEINGKDPQDAHFLVEDDEAPKEAVKRTQQRKRPPPRKISSSHATSTVGSQSNAGAQQPAKKPVPQRRTAPAKKTAGATPAPASNGAANKPAAEKSAAEKPGAEKPAAEKPAAEKPGAEKPAADKPAAAKSNAPAKKKPAPRPVQPQKKPSAASGSAAAGDDGAGSSTAVPKEKKKPRKLNPKPKPAAEG